MSSAMNIAGKGLLRGHSWLYASINTTHIRGPFISLSAAIHPNILLQAGDKELEQAAQRLREHYSRDIHPSFPGQLLCFRNSVATTERSFSKLKLIKNHLRSTMGQERLSGLVMLSIENETAKKLDIQSIVDEFVERKARRKVFPSNSGASAITDVLLSGAM